MLLRIDDTDPARNLPGVQIIRADSLNVAASAAVLLFEARGALDQR